MENTKSKTRRTSITKRKLIVSPPPSKKFKTK